MITYDAESKLFYLSNHQITYIMAIESGDILTHRYFGPAIRHLHQSYPRVNRGFSGNLPEVTDAAFSKDAFPQEFGGTDTGDYRIPALTVRTENGARTTDFRYDSYRILTGKPELNGLPSAYVKQPAEAETLIITMRDKATGILLELSYTLYADRAVIARNTQVVNATQSPVTILKIASAQVDFERRHMDVISLPGAHLAERHVQRQPIKQDLMQFESRRGTSSHQMNPFIAVVDHETTEFTGDAYGFMLVYSGNHQMSVERDQVGQIRVVMGINAYNFAWQLAAGERFQTPEALLVYAAHGLNEMSQTYHHLLRERVARGQFQYQERPILINNWEATMFQFDEQKLTAIVDEAQKLGIEMFVLDDGWFGHRDNDDSSLGDWHVDRQKLPHGLSGMAQIVHTRGMQFGLWFEPEMISEDSELFEAHPEYRLQVPGRAPSPSREQYVLDFSQKAVVDNIYAQMAKILDTGAIDYIKWDMNRSLSDVYSIAWRPEQEGEINHRYMLGVYQLMAQLTTAYPHILFEGCSGGGGRFDAGLLAYMPQHWTSDNTDPIDRQYIQYGTSLAYPISAMTAHVSDTPNQQTGRSTSMETRGDVAMSAVLGYELDLSTISEADKATIQQQIKFYKAHRQLIQYGTFIRLESPYEHNEFAWEFVNEDQSEALVFEFKRLADARKLLSLTTLRGLDPESDYEDQTTHIHYGGDELMHFGLYKDPKQKGDFTSSVHYFRRVTPQ